MTPRRSTVPVPIPAPATARPRQWLSALLLSASGRPVRFALTGGTAGLLQLTLLSVLTGRGWEPDLANGVAFVLAAQINFLLSSTFTWRDRLDGGTPRRRWLTFHGAIAGMAVVNLLVASAARHVMPVLPASALGIAIAAVGNFVVGDRIIFRPRSHAPFARPLHLLERQSSSRGEGLSEAGPRRRLEGEIVASKGDCDASHPVVARGGPLGGGTEHRAPDPAGQAVHLLAQRAARDL